VKPWEVALRKQSAALGSALPDPVKDMGAVAPVPSPVVENKTAPGRWGPIGMSPRTTYSRVNTGSPPVPDAGASAQKSSPPRGSEFLPAKMAHIGHGHEEAEVSMKTIAERPSLQQLVKAAMAGTISKSDISAEALRQSGVIETDSPKEKISHIPTEKLAQLADAVGYIAKMADQGNIQMPGEGPGALQVMQAESSEKNIDAGESGQALAKHIPPTNPPVQTEQVQMGKADTGLKTNESMSHAEQPIDPWSNEKATMQNDYTKQSSALYKRNWERLTKIGSEPVKTNAPIPTIRKLAEDAIFPAHISAPHHDNPPAVSAAEKDKVPVPSDTRRQAAMVASNEAAINYDKREAKENPKSDLNKVLDEPALSAAHDKVLKDVLEHHDGVKISMAQDVNRVAAARALLSNLLDKVAGEGCASKSGKKEKASMMGAAPSAPQQIPSPIA
jgi:hypothetical protein